MQPLPPDPALISLAMRLADAADDAIRPYLGQTLSHETKPDDSPVSAADRAAEAAMRALITTQYPDHGILGEEYGAHAPQARFCWVLDPIDGTRAFLSGREEWGCLIALCEDGIPVLGVLHQPLRARRWLGVIGSPTQYYESAQPRACATRAVESLAACRLSSTSGRYFTPLESAAFVALADACGGAREGGDCIAYGDLACGAHDLVADAGLKPYDILALVPIIQGAGGVISGWDGAPVTLRHYAQVLAAGDARMHAAALALLAPAAANR